MNSYVFVDYGSGKGRVLLIAAEYPFKQIVGVEFSPELHTICAENIRRALPERNIELVCGDAADYILPDLPAVLFFYHPFQRLVMQEVVRNVEASWLRAPRDLWLIYSNPSLRFVIAEHPFLDLVAEGSDFAIYRSNSVT
jgi:SAM-dependent methyltransferase